MPPLESQAGPIFKKEIKIASLDLKARFLNAAKILARKIKKTADGEIKAFYNPTDNEYTFSIEAYDADFKGVPAEDIVAEFLDGLIEAIREVYLPEYYNAKKNNGETPKIRIIPKNPEKSNVGTLIAGVIATNQQKIIDIAMGKTPGYTLDIKYKDWRGRAIFAPIEPLSASPEYAIIIEGIEGDLSEEDIKKINKKIKAVIGLLLLLYTERISPHILANPRIKPRLKIIGKNIPQETIQFIKEFINEKIKKAKKKHGELTSEELKKLAYSKPSTAKNIAKGLAIGGAIGLSIHILNTYIGETIKQIADCLDNFGFSSLEYLKNNIDWKAAKDAISAIETSASKIKDYTSDIKELLVDGTNSVKSTLVQTKDYVNNVLGLRDPIDAFIDHLMNDKFVVKNEDGRELYVRLDANQDDQVTSEDREFYQSAYEADGVIDGLEDTALRFWDERKLMYDLLVDIRATIDGGATLGGTNGLIQDAITKVDEAYTAAENIDAEAAAISANLATVSGVIDAAYTKLGEIDLEKLSRAKALATGTAKIAGVVGAVRFASWFIGPLVGLVVAVALAYAFRGRRIEQLPGVLPLSVSLVYSDVSFFSVVYEEFSESRVGIEN